ALIVGGNLSVTANGSISDSGNVTVAGTTSLGAGPFSNITLDNADDFGGDVTIVSGNKVILNDINNLTVGGTPTGDLVLTAGGSVALDAMNLAGNLSITANGTITDNGNITVAGFTSLSAGGANDITLNNADDFVGPVTIASGNNVTIN